MVRRTEAPNRRAEGFLWFAGVRPAVALLLSLFVLAAGFGQNGTPGEYQVKAAFLYHFAQYVEWPAGTFRDAASPLTYCVLGEDPFQGALEGSLSGKSVGTHPVQIQRFNQATEARVCQVVFVRAASKKSVARGAGEPERPPGAHRG